MSRELRIALVALAGVVALYFAVGSLLPTGWTVESTARIEAPPAAVLPKVVDFGAWKAWSSIGASVRPNTEVVVEGEPGTVGHRLIWRSGTELEAMLRVTAVDDDGMAYEFLNRVGGEMKPLGAGSLRLQPDGAGTLVTWTDSMVVDSFAGRWFTWFGAQQEAAKTFQQTSLSGLKSSF